MSGIASSSSICSSRGTTASRINWRTASRTWRKSSASTGSWCRAGPSATAPGGAARRPSQTFCIHVVALRCELCDERPRVGSGYRPETRLRSDPGPDPTPSHAPPAGGAVPLLNVALVPAPDQVVVRLAGDADLMTAPLITRALVEAATLGTRHVVVDISGTRFWDCSGLHALADFTADLAAAGRACRIVGATPATGDCSRLPRSPPSWSSTAHWTREPRLPLP